ncbi:hypothetical protein [Halobaculum gomorrense]|uniref:hypothetical protein n=1 Tax=Halobaculum gomorrense TaxID=43928 RepID=UPI0013562900|nr:hypothetical protein [Halobaculum gomorrense]
MVEYRRNLESVVDDDHVPADATGLVRLLSGDILARARELEDDLAAADADIREAFGSYVDRLAVETGETNERLADVTDTFAQFRAVMDYDQDRQINDLRRIRGEYGDDHGEGADDRIDDLLRLLQYFATAREYFKTLYLRDEFARLSRDLVVTMVPTTAALAVVLHFLNGIPDSHLVVAGIETLAFLPFVLVASYVLRVAVVTRRTQGAGQFVAGERAGDIRGITEE